MSTYGTKYVTTIPQFYYALKLTETVEGRTMLINNAYLRKTVSKMLDYINETAELYDLLEDNTKTKFIELMTYWKEDGDKPIFSAEDLY